MRLHVTADLPLRDDRLRMAQSWPADAEPVATGSWPSLVSALRVTGSRGSACTATSAGSDGWRLEAGCTGPLRVEYDVDYAVLAAQHWPAPRESAFADADTFVATGRSLFITTQAMQAARVAFAVPRGWRAVTPWNRDGGTSRFRAESADDLVDNLFAITRMQPDTQAAGGFRVSTLAFGAWRARRADVSHVIRAALPRYIASMPTPHVQDYLVVLLPQADTGGESFRASFALNTTTPGDIATRAVWQNTIAHELFHYWNGWRLRGSDYAATQWFQEGFTDYTANTTLFDAHLLTDAQFRAKVAAHVDAARRLQTPLDAPGTHKGPPLYSGGALVALDWDARIRRATGGKHALDDVFSTLWRSTDHGTRAYAWQDIRAALRSIVPGEDWDILYTRHVAGREPIADADVAADVVTVTTRPTR
ncbi:M61 family metallopeptidase [Lysobacter claricitrinus]|uniref:M61 family metallopeptidase n=1 Tax=Lysobacter claricitrinus TaxID=3367728 RepID=UPI0038B332E4